MKLKKFIDDNINIIFSCFNIFNTVIINYFVILTLMEEFNAWSIVAIIFANVGAGIGIAGLIVEYVHRKLS